MTGLLTEAKNETAYGKVGILGFAGSGKTHLSALIAIGLAQQLGSKKPIGFFDTETGSDFWIDRFNKSGFKMLRTKRRAFQDLMTTLNEAEKRCDVLIIDSISHVWKDFLEGYMTRLRRTRLQFQDWNVIKPEWGKFTDRYLNSKLHIIMCGRAGFEYDYFEDEETGKKELMKTGTKMKAENEMGYEPSLLLELERVRNKGVLIGSDVLHRCHVIKDRYDLIDGQAFDNATYANLKPFFDALSLGGKHVGIDTNSTSADVFDAEGQTEEYRREKRKKQLLEELQNLLVSAYPSTGAADKKAKIDLMYEVFGTRAWTTIETRSIAALSEGLGIMQAKIDALAKEKAEKEKAEREQAEREKVENDLRKQEEAKKNLQKQEAAA
ncbi:MAG: AAA family ATPase [Planctomycetota bacterium]|jgi:hypothetical protein